MLWFSGENHANGKISKYRTTPRNTQPLAIKFVREEENTMKKRSLIVLLIMTAIFVASPGLNLAQASTVVAGPGSTVVTDNDHDLQLVNCDLGDPNKACSLPPTGSTSYFAQFDIVRANIISLPGNGLVELGIDLNGPVPEAPSANFISWFWTFDNGCVGGQPGPTNKDGVRINWNGSIFTANWFVITNCNPREIDIGAPIGFSFSSDRKAVKVQADICELVARVGESLTWHAGVRRVGFGNVDFPNSIAVDTAPDVIAFNPNPPPQVINPENPAPWYGACLGIDIKPGSFPNSINPGNEGSIPVAMLSNPSFDAPSRVDQSNLLFGRTGDEDSLDFCSGAEDVNGDGLLDLVCHFTTELTGFQRGDTQGILKAYTNDPNPIFLLARDSVRIVPSK